MSRLAAAIISSNQTHPNRVSCYQTSGAVFPKQFCYYDLYVSSALSSVVFILLWEEGKWQLFRSLLLLCLCFTAHRHFWSHFWRGQLHYPHCSWVSLLSSLPVLTSHSFASNWHLPFLNQRKGENGRINYCMTTLHKKNVAGREDRTRDRPHIRRTCIRTSYRTRLSLFVTIFCGFIFVLFVLCGKDKFCIIPGSICVCFSDTHSRRKWANAGCL